MIGRAVLGTATVEFSDDGPGGATPMREPVVLLHGFTGSKETWRELRGELSRSRRVVCVDLPGHGGTDAGSGLESYSMAGAAAMVLALMVDYLGEQRFALGGYSMGGRLALWLALMHPSRIERLFLESASPGIAGDAERAQRRRSDEELAAFVESWGVPAFVERWERNPLFDSLADLEPAKLADLRRVRLGCSAQGLARCLRAMGTGAQPWLGDSLCELSLPTLLVAGALDAKFSRIAREMGGKIAGARVAIVEGAGHLPHLERPAQFNRIVAQFLDEP